MAAHLKIEEVGKLMPANVQHRLNLVITAGSILFKLFVIIKENKQSTQQAGYRGKKAKGWIV